MDPWTIAGQPAPFVGFGAMFATIISADKALTAGVARPLAGLVFSLGLVLVLVGGAKLFTGNALIVMAFASRRVSARALVRNWVLVFLGNLIGAMALA